MVLFPPWEASSCAPADQYHMRASGALLPICVPTPSSSMLFPVHFGSLVFLDSSLHLLNSGMHCVPPGFPLPLPWSGNSLKTVSWGNCGFTSFAPHFSGIHVLHYLMCNVLKNHYFIYFVQFYCCFGWNISLVPVTPFWLKMDFFSYFLLVQFLVSALILWLQKPKA